MEALNIQEDALKTFINMYVYYFTVRLLSIEGGRLLNIIIELMDVIKSKHDYLPRYKVKHR